MENKPEVIELKNNDYDEILKIFDKFYKKV